MAGDALAEARKAHLAKFEATFNRAVLAKLRETNPDLLDELVAAVEADRAKAKADAKAKREKTKADAEEKLSHAAVESSQSQAHIG